MRRINLFIPLLAIALHAACAQAGQCMGSLAEVEAFLSDVTPRTDRFEVEAKVLNVAIASDSAQIILSDGHGVRVELCRDAAAPQPAPGDTIRATGKASMSQTLEPFLQIDDLEILCHGAPPEPAYVKLAKTNAATHHLTTICTEGTVIDAVQDEIDVRFMILILKDEGVVLPMSIPIARFGDRSDLIDARIRVTGVYRRSVSGIRKVSWPNIQPLAPKDIEVVVPPPKDPFSVPPLEKRLYLMPDDIMKMSKRCVQGEVLATWAGKRMMVRTDDGRIVNVELAGGIELPPCGAEIVAAGLPETDIFRVNLAVARWKPASGRARSVRDENAEADVATAFLNDGGRNAIKGETHGKLLYAHGVVRMLSSPHDTDLRFVVDSNGLQIPVDVTSNPSILDGLEIGCKVWATGRCLLLTDAWRRDNVFPQAKGLALVVRSPEDVVITSRPPWWTPARLLMLIAILLLTLAAVEAWNLMQRHFARLKIAERTRLAVELHDSLSQNLAGVACQVAAGCNAIEDDPKTATTRIKAAERMLQSCRTELRHCLFDLRSDMLEATTFSAAILKALNQLADEASISIRFTAKRSDFPDPAAHAILSVIRELTANAIRHGHAANIRIAGCTDNGKLLFSVSDDGTGFDPERCPGIAEGHFGLVGVRDRLKRLNGTIDFSSEPGKGAKATVTLPVPQT